MLQILCVRVCRRVVPALAAQRQAASRRVVPELVEGPPLLCKQAPSTDSAKLTNQTHDSFSKKNFTRTKSCHPDKEPLPRRRTVTQTKNHRPDEEPSPWRCTAAQTKCRHPNEALSPRRSAATRTKLVPQTKYRHHGDVPSP